MTVSFTCRGHPDIRATHAKTIEFTKAAEITARATCVIGTAADWNAEDVARLRGRIVVTMEIGELTQQFEAVVSRAAPGDSLIFRRGPDLAERTFAHASSCAASGVNREIVRALRSADAVLRVSIDESSPEQFPGTLFVVGLPIGNVSDLSPRAKRVIEGSDLVLVEDTRRFRALAREADIRYPELVSFFVGNEARREDEVISRLRKGARVALVSDAGTPLLSDPGFSLVRKAVEANVRVTPIPGPNAAIAAVSVAAIPVNEVLFVGFPPRRREARRRLFERLSGYPATLVLFEAPHRVLESVSDLARALPDREMCIARELTKIHEEIVHTTTTAAGTFLEDNPPRGELTLVIEGARVDPTVRGPDTAVQAVIAALARDVPTKTLALALVTALGLSRGEAYDFVLDAADLRTPRTSTNRGEDRP